MPNSGFPGPIPGYSPIFPPLLLQNHLRRLLAAQNMLKFRNPPNLTPGENPSQCQHETERKTGDSLTLFKQASNEKITDIDIIYSRTGLARELITGGTPKELLQPPVKSVGFRTETQIKLMRKMRHVANKLNLTQVSIDGLILFCDGRSKILNNRSMS